jgi:transcriptional regulator with XRE-family HTH domain
MEPHTSTAVIGKQVAKYRGRLDWSAAKLAGELQTAGVQWERPDVTKLERGFRKSVTVDQALALAEVLNVPLVHLLVPPDDGDAPYRVTADVTEPSYRVRGWIRGLFPLRRLPRVGDVRQFWAVVPLDEFEAMQQGQCPCCGGRPPRDIIGQKGRGNG